MIPTNVNNLTIKEFIEYENIRTSSLENIDKIIQIASSFTDISVSEYEYDVIKIVMAIFLEDCSYHIQVNQNSGENVTF